MTLRISNERALAILPPTPVEGIGWSVRFISETDYETVLAHTTRFTEGSFSIELSDTGAFSLKMRGDDPLWSLPLPAGQTGDIRDRECLVQFLYEGIVQFEGLLEDVQPEEVSQDGHPMIQLSGRGVAALLERAIVLPEGMPAPLVFTREFTGPVMAAWLTLLDEAQARGIAQKITPSFTAAVDTYLIPWSETANTVVNPGQDLLSLLKSQAETMDLTWLVLPRYRSLVCAADYGSHLAGSVIFYQGRHIRESEKKATRREISTSIFAQGADSSIATAAGNTAKWGVREKWVTTGQAGDISTAQAVATAEARISGDEKVSRSVSLIFDSPGRRPFEDYRVGDWVGVEATGGAINEVRIVAISIRIDEAGNADSEITLQTKFESEEIRTRKALARLGSETTSEGTGQQAISVVQAVSGQVRLRDLADVQAPTPGNGQLLSWSTASSAWVPASPGGLPAYGGNAGRFLSNDGSSLFWQDPDLLHGTPTWADEFTDGSTAAYTKVYKSGREAVTTWVESNGRLSVSHTANADTGGEMHALLQPIGAAWAIGDALVVCYDVAARYATNYVMVGACLTNGITHGTSNLVQVQSYINTGQASLGLHRVNANAGMNADTASSTGIALTPFSPLYSRLVMTGATTWRADFSCDGISWVLGNSATYTITPTHLGVCVGNWTVANPFAVSFRFLRRYSGVS